MFDTLKLEFEPDTYRINEPNDLFLQTLTSPDHDTRSQLISIDRSNGKPYICQNLDSGLLKIEFSAKILGKGYLNGIRDSGELRERLEELSPIRCNRESIENAIVLRSDYTVNVRVKSNKIAKTILGLKRHMSYGRKKFDTRYTSSVIFYNSREHLIAYNKYKEINKSKNKWILDLEGIKSEIVDLLRFELRPKGKEVLADYHNYNRKNLDEIPRLPLKHLFNNYKNVLNKKIDDISLKDSSGFSENEILDFVFSGEKLKDNLAQLGAFVVMRTINFDTDFLEDYLSEKTKVQRHRAKKLFKESSENKFSPTELYELAYDFIYKLKEKINGN